jgi:hypothetical protein
MSLLVNKLEVALFYLDTAVSGVVLLTGMVHFIRDAWEDD